MEDVHHLLRIPCIWLIACHLIIYMVNNNCHYIWQLRRTEPDNKLAGLYLHISKKDMFRLHLHELELNISGSPQVWRSHLQGRFTVDFVTINLKNGYFQMLIWEKHIVLFFCFKATVFRI